MSVFSRYCHEGVISFVSVIFYILFKIFVSVKCICSFSQFIISIGCFNYCHLQGKKERLGVYLLIAEMYVNSITIMIVNK